MPRHWSATQAPGAGLALTGHSWCVRGGRVACDSGQQLRRAASVQCSPHACSLPVRSHAYANRTCLVRAWHTWQRGWLPMARHSAHAYPRTCTTRHWLATQSW